MEEKQLKILLAHIEDDIELVLKDHGTRVTDFLDPAGQKRAEDLLHKYPGISYCKVGGYTESERNVFIIYPEYLDVGDISIPIKGLKLTWNDQYYQENHRDVLGAVLGLGIKREKIGDIVINNNAAYIFAAEEIADYIYRNLLKVGRAPVNVAISDCDEMDMPDPKTKEIRTTVASLRLDSIIGSGFGFSRNKAIPFIKSGNVSVNWEPVLKPDFLLKEGDMVSIKGKGRVRVQEIGGTTKKDRVNIVLARFI